MKQGSDAFTVSVTTAWVALPTHKADHVSIKNKTGADLLVRKADRANPDDQITLEDDESVGMYVSDSCSDIEIKAAGGATGVQVVTQYANE